MKIVNIVPGFGGTFYCGNCLRDSAFASTLRQSGHEAVMLPMYLPLTLNGGTINQDIPVFYGAVNIFLKQQFPFMRKMPSWLEKFFNSALILRLAARNSGSTRASGLVGLTESMLLGKEGNQFQELRELTDFLKIHEKPDIVHFSNALLIGLAKQVKEEVGVPVVCSLQDEDVWVDAMNEEHRKHIWNLLAEKARDVDAFIAVSQFFAGKMQKEMNIPDHKLHVVPIGIDPTLYAMGSPRLENKAIGYLSRLCEENGFGILIDAFILLKQRPEFRDVRLIATGGQTGDDKKFISAQIRKLKKAGIAGDLEILPDFSLNDLPHFFSKITVLSVPVLKGEAFGLYQLESLASGIPIIQPELGAFPEIVKATGGGQVYTPNTPLSLAKTLEDILPDNDKLLEMSRLGRVSIEQKYNSLKLTEQILNVYSSVIH